MKKHLVSVFTNDSQNPLMFSNIPLSSKINTGRQEKVLAYFKSIGIEFDTIALIVLPGLESGPENSKQNYFGRAAAMIYKGIETGKDKEIHLLLDACPGLSMLVGQLIGMDSFGVIAHQRNEANPDEYEALPQAHKLMY